eukprot:5012968-Prymnesium_polylepis.1
MDDERRTSGDEAPAADIDATDDGSATSSQNGKPGPKSRQRIDAVPTVRVEARRSCITGTASALRARSDRIRCSTAWSEFRTAQRSRRLTICPFSAFLGEEPMTPSRLNKVATAVIAARVKAVLVLLDRSAQTGLPSLASFVTLQVLEAVYQNLSGRSKRKPPQLQGWGVQPALARIAADLTGDV